MIELHVAELLLRAEERADPVDRRIAELEAEMEALRDAGQEAEA